MGDVAAKRRGCVRHQYLSARVYRRARVGQATDARTGDHDVDLCIPVNFGITHKRSLLRDSWSGGEKIATVRRKRCFMAAEWLLKSP